MGNGSTVNDYVATLDVPERDIAASLATIGVRSEYGSPSYAIDSHTALTSCAALAGQAPGVSDADGLFRISNSSAAFVTLSVAPGKALDFEVCPLYLLTVSATRSGTTARCNITVHVRDVNDHPIFAGRNITAGVVRGAIDEGDPAGTLVVQSGAASSEGLRSTPELAATDQDAGDEESLVWGVESEDAVEVPFVIINTAHGPRVALSPVVGRGGLDFEALRAAAARSPSETLRLEDTSSAPLLAFNVTVTDSSGALTRVRFEVEVRDINERPVILGDSAGRTAPNVSAGPAAAGIRREVPENAAPGTPVAVVGFGRAVAAAVAEPGPGLSGSGLSLDHHCAINASDEDAAQSLVFGIVPAGQGAGPPASVTPAGLFEVHSTTGVIRLLRALDRESATEGGPVHFVRVRACDDGLPSLCDEADVRIEVLDVNEPPVVAEAQVFTLPENAEPGSEAAAVGVPGAPVAVSDPDDGGAFTFSILESELDINGTSGLKPLFKIGPLTGKLAVVDDIDVADVWSSDLSFEAPPRAVAFPVPGAPSEAVEAIAAGNYFRIVVRACNAGPDGRAQCGQATVVVALSDVNEAPRVVPGQSLGVREQSAVGSMVGPAALRAEDQDAGQTAMLQLSEATSPRSSQFAVEPSGRVTLSRAAPALAPGEPNRTEQMQVTATDGVLDSTAESVWLVVESHNFPPVVQAVVLRVPEIATAGHLVGNVFATDSNNGQVLTYGHAADSFLPETGQGLFSVDSASGAILVTAPLNHSALPSLTMRATVTDDGPVSLQASAAITIIITKVRRAVLASVSPPPAVTSARLESLRADVADEEFNALAGSGASPPGRVSPMSTLWWPQLRGSNLSAVSFRVSGAGQAAVVDEAPPAVILRFGRGNATECGCEATVLSDAGSSLGCSRPLKLRELAQCAWDAALPEARVLTADGLDLQVPVSVYGLPAGPEQLPPFRLVVGAAAAAVPCAYETRQDWHPGAGSRRARPWCACLRPLPPLRPVQESVCGNATSFRVSVPLGLQLVRTPACPSMPLDDVGKVVLTPPLIASSQGRSLLAAHVVLLPAVLALAVRTPLTNDTHRPSSRLAGSAELSVESVGAPWYNQAGVWPSGGGRATLHLRASQPWMVHALDSSRAAALAADQSVTPWRVSGLVVDIQPAADTLPIAALEVVLTGHMSNVEAAVMAASSAPGLEDMWGRDVTLSAVTGYSAGLTRIHQASPASEPLRQYRLTVEGSSAPTKSSPRGDALGCDTLPVVPDDGTGRMRPAWLPEAALNDAGRFEDPQGLLTSAVAQSGGAVGVGGRPAFRATAVSSATSLTKSGHIAAASTLAAGIVSVQLPVAPAQGEVGVVECRSSLPSLVGVAAARGTRSAPARASPASVRLTRAWWRAENGLDQRDDGGLVVITGAGPRPNFTVAVWGMDATATSPPSAVEVSVTCSLRSERPDGSTTGAIAGAVFGRTSPIVIPVLWAPVVLPAVGEAVEVLNASAVSALLRVIGASGTMTGGADAPPGGSVWVRASDRSEGIRSHLQGALDRSAELQPSAAMAAVQAAADTVRSLSLTAAGFARAELTEVLTAESAADSAAGTSALLGSALIVRLSASREVTLVCATAAALFARGINPRAIPAARCMGRGTRVFVGGAEAPVLSVLGGGLAATVTMPPLTCGCGLGANASSLSLPAGSSLVEVAGLPTNGDGGISGCGARPLTIVNLPMMRAPSTMTATRPDRPILNGSRCDGIVAKSVLAAPDSTIIVACDAAAVAASHAAVASTIALGSRLGGCATGSVGVSDLISERIGPLLQTSRRLTGRSAAAPPALAVVSLSPSGRATASAPAPWGVGFTVTCAGFPSTPALCMDPDAVLGGLQCAFGEGDACRACPRGALCPGGFSSLPLPGFWTADISSGRMARCGAPAELRCPGWLPGAGVVKSLCGVGFTGPACGLCEPGYFPESAAGCESCPDGSALQLVLIPLAVYAGVGAGLVLLTFCALRGLAAVTGAPPGRVARSASQFAMWAVLLLQTISQVGSASRPGLAPELARLYTLLSVFELDPSIGVHPSCIVGAPLVMEVAILSLVGLLAVTALAALAVIRGYARSAATSEADSTAKFSVRARKATPSLAALQRSTTAQLRLKRDGLCGCTSKVALTGLILSFSIACTTAFGLLNCVPGTGALSSSQVLSGNQFLPCGQGLHAFASPFAVVILTVAAAAIGAALCDATRRVRRAAAHAKDSSQPDYGRGCCLLRAGAHSKHRATSGPGVASGRALKRVDGRPRSLLDSISGPTVAMPDRQLSFHGPNPLLGAKSAKAGSSGQAKTKRLPGQHPRATDTRLALRAHIEAMTSLAPLLQAEYRAWDAPAMRAADLMLIVILAGVGTFLGPDSAEAVARNSTGEADEVQVLVSALTYASAASAVIVSCCGGVVALMYCGFGPGPYIPEDAWKRPIRAGSLLLAAVASLLNALNAAAAVADARADLATELLGTGVQVMSLAVLTLSIVTVVALVVGFWSSMLSLALAEAPSARSCHEGQRAGPEPCLLRVARYVHSQQPSSGPSSRKTVAARASLASALSSACSGVTQNTPDHHDGAQNPLHASKSDLQLSGGLRKPRADLPPSGLASRVLVGGRQSGRPASLRDGAAAAFAARAGALKDDRAVVQAVRLLRR